jgi:phosphopantothenoylcysteine decarboxylase/phosphopantothenate--cysteine ligase
MLSGKKILVGVTGSIAAYKAAVLIRLLIREGADVRVLMTAHAREFITPLTLATLSRHPVLTEFFNPENGDWNNHVDLGIWADAFVVAPASANTLAKMASGIADNLLLTTYLSSRCPVFVAPAMDLDMLSHPATRKNLDILRSFGNNILEPATGDLASGLTGKGRMEEPEIIVEQLHLHFAADVKKKDFPDLTGRTMLVTAGPTHEPLDAVRFIGNHSSGKMGFAIASALRRCGANVILVCGPVSLPHPGEGIEYISVQTALQMFDACVEHFSRCDAAIMAAAVADYRPATYSSSKIKRKDDTVQLELVSNPDIAAHLGKLKKKGQILAGFALETDNEMVYAQEKLRKKNLDFIVLNSLRDEGSGFMTETNRITLIDKDNKSTRFELKSKQDAAADIVRHLAKYFTS